ncbi:MAG: 6-pyruvoyl trahydropterin synthase family protein [Thermoguttaceae bacterium]
MSSVYTLTREFEFCYGHRLASHAGRCRNLHGHNATVHVTLRQESLSPDGMVIDFGHLKKLVGDWIDATLDHKTLLAATDPLADVLASHGEAVVALPFAPTAENLARFISESLRDAGVPVYSVTFWETPRCSVTYTAQ